VPFAVRFHNRYRRHSIIPISTGNGTRDNLDMAFPAHIDSPPVPPLVSGARQYQREAIERLLGSDYAMGIQAIVASAGNYGRKKGDLMYSLEALKDVPPEMLRVWIEAIGSCSPLNFVSITLTFQQRKTCVVPPTLFSPAHPNRGLLRTLLRPVPALEDPSTITTTRHDVARTNAVEKSSRARCGSVNISRSSTWKATGPKTVHWFGATTYPTETVKVSWITFEITTCLDRWRTWP
jgi:hypothetical protein